ncbi:hypothetical protein F5879DRAFT_994402 [Lentinula edodes]|nr:hypothetical protein F5879DRAFT_994402 [Lentinula edodes]
MFGHLPPSPPLTASLEPKIGTEFYELLASQAVAGIALCATCPLTYPALLSIMFGHLPPSPPLTESLEPKIGTEFYELLASQAVASIALCATCHLTYPILLSIMFGHLPPSPPPTAPLEPKIGTEFYELLASQAVAGIALCATCHLTYPALLSIMFCHLPPSPPLTASLEPKIGTEFYELLASQAVADIVLCATCHLTYPALLLIIFGHLPPSPPVTELLATTISTEFYEPLASQAVAGIVLCATCNLTYPALLSVMFGHLPPSPPLTESLGTKISTGFYEPLVSQAVAGIVLCATCNLTYPTLLLIIFGHLPPSPPVTESLRPPRSALSSISHFPLKQSQVLCRVPLVTWHILHYFRPCSVTDQLHPLLRTKSSSEFHQPLASQAGTGLSLCIVA